MRPGTCGVTVTDSNAPLRPTSSRYVGTARETAGAAVTSGAMGGGAAAPAFPRLHAAAAVSAPSTLMVPTHVKVVTYYPLKVKVIDLVSAAATDTDCTCTPYFSCHAWS